MFKKELFVLLILLIGFTFLEFGSALSDVDNDGYLEIHDCYELQSMNNNLSANYELANDIDCSMTRGWNIDYYCSGGPNILYPDGTGAFDFDICRDAGYTWEQYYQGFKPIGNNCFDWDRYEYDHRNLFTGNFKGNNHYVQNLYIDNKPFVDTVNGLFGCTKGSTITGLHLSNIDMTGSHVGGLIYYLDGGQISCSSVEGRLKGGWIGGVTVYADHGQVINSFFKGDIYVNNSRYGELAAGGGVVNYIWGHDYDPVVISSYSEGNISGEFHKSYVSIISGGIASKLVAGGVYNSYSTMNFIIDKTSPPSSLQSVAVGPLVGMISNGYPPIVNSYATGYLSEISPFDRFFGKGVKASGGWPEASSSSFFDADNYFRFVSTAYWDSISSPWDYSDSFSRGGKTTIELKTPSTFTDAGWDSNIWRFEEGYYPALYMRECTPVEVKYNITFNLKEDERGNNANIICSAEIKNLPSGNGRVNFSLYAMNGTNKTLISSSGFIDMESSEENGYYYLFKNYTFENALGITSPVMKCSAEFEDLDSDNIGGFYDSDYIKDVDGDGYMSFWQANSIGKCSDFNVDVEGEDDWPYDDTWGQLYGKTSDSDRGPSCLEFDKINCSLDSNSDGLSDYNLCAKCRNKIYTCSDIEDNKYIGKCESGNKTGYWLRGVGWMPSNTFLNWMLAHQYPNYISNLSCDSFYIISPPLTDESFKARKEKWIETSEYLTINGLIEVVKQIEEEYKNQTKKDLESRYFNDVIASTYYNHAATTSDGITGPISFFWTRVSRFSYSRSSNLALSDLVNKFILRHPEFYSGDIMSTSLLLANGAKSPLQPKTKTIASYAFPLGYGQDIAEQSSGGDCVIKKVYFGDNIVFSISHTTMTASSWSPRLSALAMEFGLGILPKVLSGDINGGYGFNKQNIYGDLLGVALKWYVDPYWVGDETIRSGAGEIDTLVPNPFYTPNLSDALGNLKRDIRVLAIGKVSSLSSDKLSEYCKLVGQQMNSPCGGYYP